ncbi:hypothetical protein BG004_007870 [Podila humilis]|nr:hypothetical protein BG004_007870 [Podila humilis]
MLGWAISFGARTPIYAIVAKYVTTDPDLSEWYTLLPAAFVEETVRLVVIWITAIGPDFGAVFWLGLGWAGLETVYYIGQSLVYSRYWYSPSEQQQQQQQQQQNHLIGEQDSLLRQHHIGRRGQQQQHHHHHLTKDVEDPVEAKEVRHLLGIDRPWWSLMGRTSSMMVHIGLGCWIGHSGLKLLLPAAIVHGALYIVWGVFIEHWSVPATSYGTFMSAMGIFLVGLALYGEIV